MNRGTNRFLYKGKGAKIATVNLKMGTYNSCKFKGAKPYNVNQNEAKVISLLGKVKRTFSRCDPTINKWRVIHLRVQYVDGALFFQMSFIFSNDYEQVRWISHDLGFIWFLNEMIWRFRVRFKWFRVQLNAFKLPRWILKLTRHLLMVESTSGN